MSTWGKLASRYEGKENEKHKILALDGGGIRGILTLEVMARMEDMLVVSVGIGAAAALVKEVEDPNRGLIDNVAALPSALMQQ